MASSLYNDETDGSVEEEVIVVLDESYTDHSRDEILAEFVMEESLKKPLPTPPRPKSAFEAYNDQLKGSVAKTNKNSQTQEKSFDAYNAQLKASAAITPPQLKKKIDAAPASKPAAVPSWVKKTPADENTDEPKPAEKSQFKRSPVVLPKWLEKKELPAAPELEVDSEKPEVKVAPPTRRWKKPVAQTETQSKSEEGTEANKSAVPWLKPSTDQTTPPAPQPTAAGGRKGKLLNRYLAVVSNEDAAEQERRRAEIEADRARGRWDGNRFVPDGDGGEDGSGKKKNWKYQQPKEKQAPKEQFDEGAAIKLQAIVRGFLARRRVAKYVDDLIADMMRKINAAQAEEEARRKAIEEEERRKREEEEFRLWQEREEERRKNEEEEIRRRMHDDRYGLPIWWMKLVPHKTMDQKEYKAIVKKDKGFTVIDYKLPPRNSEKLDAVTEEKEDEEDDENNSNLDKILESSARAQRTIGSLETKNQPNAMVSGSQPNTTANTKKKKSMFSCMNIDSVVPEESAVH